MTTPVQIPVVLGPNGVVLPAFSSDVALDGVNYRVRMYWALRAQTWMLDIYDATGLTLLVGGLSMKCGLPVFHAPWMDNVPKGSIYVVDTSQQDLDPGLEDLGGRVLVVYIPPPGA